MRLLLFWVVVVVIVASEVLWLKQIFRYKRAEQQSDRARVRSDKW